MAIRKSSADSKASLPTQLETLLLEGFSFQAVRDAYEGAFKDTKGQITTYLAHNEDGFSCDMGKGFSCEQGTVIYQSRANWNIDKDKLLELVEGGKLTLATLVNLAKFDATALKTAIGEKEFNDLAVNAPTEYLTLRANSEFKASVSEQFADVLPKPTEPTEAVEEKPAKKIEVVKKSSLDKKPSPKVEVEEREADPKATAAYIRSLKGKSKAKITAEEELDQILSKGNK